MRSVDDYCLKKQWMYHIGREKGVTIGRFLEDSLKRGDWANKVRIIVCVICIAISCHVFATLM